MNLSSLMDESELGDCQEYATYQNAHSQHKVEEG